jgi:penicillin G amidase
MSFVIKSTLSLDEKCSFAPNITLRNTFMRLLRNILLVLLLIIVLVLVGGFVLFNDLTRGPLPTIDGEIRVSGLQDTVTVKRDDWGVPHIYASNMHDLLFAQGYTQAQDRWWQMEFFRATGDGRLQELTGRNNDLMGNDVFIRTIGWRQAAERDIAEVFTDEDRERLQAFTDGVNAYINGKAGGDLALDYSLLGVNGVNIPVRLWTLGDTVVWQKVMAWDLSNGMYDVQRAQLVETLGEDLYSSLEPAYPFDRNPTIVQPDDAIPTEASLASYPLNEKVSGYASANLSFAGNLTDGARFAFGQGEGLGSNNWVVSGDMTRAACHCSLTTPILAFRCRRSGTRSGCTAARAPTNAQWMFRASRSARSPVS